MTDRPPSAAGDAALDAIYRAHAHELKRVAFLITGSNATAEDAVHEVFLRCADRLHEIDHPPSYLRRAVIDTIEPDPISVHQYRLDGLP